MFSFTFYTSRFVLSSSTVSYRVTGLTHSSLVVYIPCLTAPLPLPTMRISLFSGLRDTTPHESDVSWQELAGSFSRPTLVDDKAGLPLWSPAFFSGHRDLSNVVELSCLALDIDDVDEDTALSLCDALSAYCAFVHSSFSHRPPSFRFRAVVALTRPVRPDEWPLFWDAAFALFPQADPQCKDASRAYFGAACPPERVDSFFFLQFGGAPLDVDLLLGTPAAPSPAPLPPPASAAPITKAAFDKFARLTKAARASRLADLGEALCHVSDGEAWAPVGHRDATLFSLCCILAERWPDAPPLALASFFAASCSRMAHEPEPPTVLDVEYKLRRAQEAIRAERSDKQVRELTFRQRRIAEAFRNGRITPYAKEEYAPPERWIIQRDTAYYFFVDGTYEGPYTYNDAPAAAVRDLMPAHHVVDLYRMGKDGALSLKNMRDLVAEYGTVAQEMVADLRAQSSYYRENERTIVEAPCPFRKLEPQFSPEVDQYYRLLSGTRYPDFLTFIAALFRLDLPCAALFLVGPKGAGKSLFAYAHARIWTLDRPTYLDEALDNYNDAIMTCPLTLADESLPKDMRGFVRSAELRHHIQAVTRPLKRKWLPVTTMHGACRTVVCANNEEVLANAENLGSDDIGAIAARYFFLRVPEECAEYLAQVRPREAGWVDQDVVARHAMHVALTHEWQPTERFLIPCKDEQVHRSLTVRSGARSAVCQWLVGYLLNPRKFNSHGLSAFMCLVSEGQLLCNVQALVNAWAMYVTEPQPTVGKLSGALGSLSFSERKQLRVSRVAKNNYRHVNAENLIAWAEEMGFSDRATIEAALARDTDLGDVSTADTTVN